MRLLSAWRFLAIVLPLLCVSAGTAPETTKIGVLAVNGVEACRRQWTPTIEYLTAHIPSASFEIVPLAYGRVHPAVAQREVDFVLANPSFYIELEIQHGAQRLATLKRKALGKPYTEYGSAIFCRSDRTDIRELTYLKGKTFMAVAEGSLGGWRAAWREFQDHGINPHKHFAELLFGGSQNRVVRAVRDGQADAGAVRTATLEEMAEAGEIALKDFRVFHEHIESHIELPFLYSTVLYPEWPMAKLRRTPDDLSQKVAIALMAMPRNCTAAKAAGCAGWTIPLSYEPVRECLKALKVGPYERLGEITLAALLRQHWEWLLGGLLMLIGTTAVAGYTRRLNRGLRTSQRRLQAEIAERERTEQELRRITAAVENSSDAVGICDPAGKGIYHNRAFVELFGYNSEELDAAGGPAVCFSDPDVARSVFEAVLSGHSWSGEVESVTRSGDIVPMLLRCDAVRDEAGQVVGTVGIHTDITERKQMLQELRTMSLVDQLTGLNNRRGFFTLAAHQLKSADRSNTKMVVIYADLDGLKWINDNLGHEEGDRALIETADLLRETFRQSDIIARLGGDEFVVLAADVPPHDADTLVARLEENLRARNVQEGRRYELAISAGTASYDPGSACTVEELLRESDGAMYEQKQAHKALAARRPDNPVGHAV